MGITHRVVRRGVAVLVLAGTIAVAAGMIVGPQHAAAQGIPNKTCTGTGAGGAAAAGKSDVCTVSVVGALANGDAFVITPTAPAHAVVTGCTGTTVASPFAYTSTGAVTADNSCTFTISGLAVLTAGNNLLGTETFKIPSGTAAGTSVTQEAKQCGLVPPPPAPGSTLVCGPATPMGTSGPGSCVGAAAPPDRRVHAIHPPADPDAIREPDTQR